MKKTSTFLLLLLFNYSAHAASVASDSTPITTPGQTYAQSFIVDPSLFSNVVLSLDVFGDYGDSEPDEHFNFFIDGSLLADLHGTEVNPLPGTITAITDESCCSWHFTGDIVIDNALWAAFSADGSLDISWTNGQGVDVIASSNFVDWSLNGTTASAVPVPAAIWFMGSALLGLFGFKRKSV